MNKDTIALYSGWGPVESTRNPGDSLCHEAATKLLEPHIETEIFNIRNSNRPVTDPWMNDSIIGGGTVLPTVFQKNKAPGLLESRSIYIFGSGCLSQEELSILNVESIKTNIKEQFIPIGVRGPLSSKWFKEFYGLTVSWIGDLAFYFAQSTLKKHKTKKIAFYCIEDDRNSSRLSSDLSEIINIFNATLEMSQLDSYKKIFYQTLPVQIDIQALLKNDFEFIKTHGVEEYTQSIISADFIITERLHPAIIAACYGIPFLYLQTTSKSYDLEAMFSALKNGDVISQLFLDMAKPERNFREKIVTTFESDQYAATLLEISSAIKNKLKIAAQNLARMVKQKMGGSLGE